MKLISTLVFLLLTGLQLKIGKELTDTVTLGIRNSARRNLKFILLRLAFLLNTFVQFWLLTRFFSLGLILLLLAAALLGSIIFNLLGAITGFTLEDNKKKIGVLGVIWGAQSPLFACITVIVSLLIILVSTVGSLWVFWRNPVGAPDALVWVALFLFVLPQIISIPLNIGIVWPLVTSEYLDDDVRNSHLASTFSNIVYQTIMLLFPIWLFKQEISNTIQHYNWSLPPFWVLLSLPLLIFMFGGLLPFFVGVYRYRAQARAMLLWQKRWLKGLSEINKLPAGETRDNALDEKLAELQAEISRRFEQNSLFTFYQKLVQKEKEGENEPAIAEAENFDAVQQLPVSATIPGTALISRPPDIRDAIKTARAVLKGARPPRSNTSTDWQEAALDIIRDNQANLVEWDIRFQHLSRLLQLYDIGLEGKTKNISAFIKDSLSDVDKTVTDQPKKNNIIAGAILTTSSTVLVWLFQHYETGILNLVSKVVK